jgi:hypothetical protein
MCLALIEQDSSTGQQLLGALEGGGTVSFTDMIPAMFHLDASDQPKVCLCVRVCLSVCVNVSPPLSLHVFSHCILCTKYALPPCPSSLCEPHSHRY